MVSTSHDPQSNPVTLAYPSNKYPPQGPPAYPLPYQVGGYAPAPLYHGGYAPNTGNPNIYSSTSMNLWYASQKYGPWAPEENSSKRFAQVMFATMLTLLICMVTVSLAMWFLFGVEVPIYEVQSLSVSNLHFNESTVEAHWAVNLTVTNPNSDLTVYSGLSTASIFYRNYPLAVSSVDPFDLEGQRQHSIYILWDKETTTCKDSLLAEMMENESRGTLYLSLRLAVGAKFSSSSIWRREYLKVYCEDLKMDITKEGKGELATDISKECLVFS